MDNARERLSDLMDAAREAADLLQLHAERLEREGESSSAERIAVMRLNMALLALEQPDVS